MQQEASIENVTEIIQGVLTKIEFYYQDVNPAVHYKLGVHNGVKNIFYSHFYTLTIFKIFSKLPFFNRNQFPENTPRTTESPQGTVLLRKPYYQGTDLVLKLQYMTFEFSKSPFSARCQAILIFETKKNGYLLSF